MIVINENVVYVKGALNGAIYDFNSHQVFSINNEAGKILDDFIAKKQLSIDGIEYIDELEKHGLIEKHYQFHDYILTKKSSKKVNFAWLELTNSCNLKCVHCYQGDEHVNKFRVVDSKKWEKVIRDLYDLGCRNLQFIGGEPTLSPLLLPLISYAYKLGIDKLSVFTNGTHINRLHIQSFKEHGVKVRVSIYGHTPEIHDSISLIKGSFYRTQKAIQEMVNEGISVSPAVVIMKNNETFVNEVNDYATQIANEKLTLDVIRPVYKGNQVKYAPTIKEVEELSLRTKPYFLTNKTYFDHAVNYNTCLDGKLAITSEGEVIPCEFMRDSICGNIHQTSLSDIVQNGSLDKYWNLSYDKIETCKDCEFKYACKDCRAVALSKKNNLYEKNLRCSYNPYSGEWLKKT